MECAFASAFSEAETAPLHPRGMEFLIFFAKQSGQTMLFDNI